MVVQWVRLPTFTVGDAGWIPGLRSKILHAARCGQKTKRKQNLKKKKDIYVNIYFYIFIYQNHFATHMKLTQHCKSTMLFKKLNKHILEHVYFWMCDIVISQVPVMYAVIYQLRSFIQGPSFILAWVTVQMLKVWNERNESLPSGNLPSIGEDV